MLVGHQRQKRMIRIDLQDGRDLGHFLAGLAHHPRHDRRQAVFVGDHAGRRIGQALAGLDVADPLAQRLLDPAGQLPGLVTRLDRLAQIELAAGHGLQRFALVLVQVADQPFIDPVGQQQDLDAVLAKGLQVRAVARHLERVGGQVPDVVLVFVHPGDVVVESGQVVIPVGGCGGKPQQAGNALALLEILDHALLEHRSERVQELAPRLAALLGQLLDQVEAALDHGGADFPDQRRILQHLARDVERQVGRVDHPAHEAQVARHHLFGGVHDEHPLDVELDAFALVAIDQHIERR